MRIMPNWCSNRLAVTGPQAEVERFVAAAVGPEYVRWVAELGEPEVIPTSHLSLPTLIPPPAELLTTVVYDGASEKPVVDVILAILGTGRPFDGHTWQLQNWGTKWGPPVDSPAMGLLDDQGILEAVYEFSTAWSPISAAVATMAGQYPLLTFKHEYIKEGNCFWGKDVWTGGQQTGHAVGDAGLEHVMDYYRMTLAEAREYMGLDDPITDKDAG